jgi:DNA-directed RNA polymerase subunit RPC12/RpoP
MCGRIVTSNPEKGYITEERITCNHCGYEKVYKIKKKVVTSEPKVNRSNSDFNISG